MIDNIHLISIIVPIYNVEKYLRRCVDSIAKQTYRNLEILLIDDGSTDSCGKICDEYAAFDKRINVIHKTNGGLSDARNVALDICTGDYIVFIDSDDFVSELYIENLYNSIIFSGADMSSCQFIEFYDGGSAPQAKSISKKDILVLNSERYLEKMLYQNFAETCAWGKIYKRFLFDDIRFPYGKLYEDVPTTYKVILKCMKTAIIPNTDYYYYQRSESIHNAKFKLKKWMQ